VIEMSTGTELQTTNGNGIEVPAESTSSRRTFVPRADIFETPRDIVVLADLPGVDERDIDITVEKNILTIRANVQPELPHAHSLTYAEYTVGDFLRKFALPNEIDREGIAATMKNGVLRLVLPKSSSAQVRKIQVKSE
jgi:HSP20 family molecular chaperone IbpA